jgi:predicted RNA-binding Zn-ribbon protein involved in translation (DUF1610 family)
MSNRVYKYGAKAPIHPRSAVPSAGSAIVAESQDIEDRLWEGNQYYNKLVEIEQNRRATADAIMLKYDSELPTMQKHLMELDAEIKASDDAVKKANQKEGRKKRKSQSTKLRKTRKLLQQQIRAHEKVLRQVEYSPEIQTLEADYKALKVGPNSAVRSEMKARLNQAKESSGGYGGEIAQNNNKAAQAMATLYSESRLFWCQKNQLMDAFKTACKKHPKYHRYEGSGSLFTQIQGGIPHTGVVEPNPWFYITGSGRTRLAWIRIDSIGQAPVYTVVPFIMHRDLPICRIKGVSLVRKRCATKISWEIQINCEGVFESDSATNKECVAIDLGWRKTPTGRKIAHLISTTGEQDVLEIPAKMLARWEQVDDLQSVRDDKFNAVLMILGRWLKTHTLPEWLAEKTRHIHAWRSQNRLAGLIFRWRHERFPGDEAIFHLLDGSPADSNTRKSNISCSCCHNGRHLKHWNGWRCWDKHLYEWQENLRQKAIRWRKDYYRKFAARLSRRYGILRVEDVDWSKTIRQAVVEDMSNDGIRAGQRFAAPGLLRKILESRFHCWERVKAAGTTSTCSKCKQQVSIGALDSWTCPNCGTHWDRDENACYNILLSSNVTKASGPVVPKTP